MKKLFNLFYHLYAVWPTDLRMKLITWRNRRSRSRHAKWLRAVRRKNQRLGYTREF